MKHRGGSVGGKLVGLRGDLSVQSAPEIAKAFRRQIKKIGVLPKASSYLPVRPFQKAGGDNS